MTSIQEAREIGKRIAQARKRAGLDQAALGRRIGLKGKDPSRSIQNYESGATAPFNRLDKIAQATGVTKDWLLRGPVEQPQLDRIEAKLDRVLAALTPRDEAAGDQTDDGVPPPRGLRPTDEETDEPQTGSAG